MSDFMEMLVEMLPLHSELNKTDNPVRKVLDQTIGEYMDNHSDIYDEMFLTSASEGWLDAWGRDYGVPRRLNESDDDYRDRIVFEKLEYMTAGNLQEFYGLNLYAHVSDYNPRNNTLTSDNPYASGKHMSIADSDLKKTLNSKFILDYGVTWL